MANRSRFVSSLKTIRKFLEDTDRKAFSRNDLSQIFEEMRQKWNLPLSMDIERFLTQLTEKADFRKLNFSFPGLTPKTVYASGDEVTVQEIAVAIYEKGYLSHYSALEIHNLTEQIPKTVYLTVEQSKRPAAPGNSLTQHGIDAAFSKPQRVSESKQTFDGYEIVLLKGKNTGHAGIRSLGNVRVTDLERTLIDAAVRPAYSGGVAEVLKAFTRAGDLKVSVNKLLGYLDKINLIYPYHQAIGFYMEKSGAYSDTQIEKLSRFDQKFRFYLAYDMKAMEFSERWNLYYPKGL